MSNTTWKKDCQKILDVFTADKNASPFLAPVPWKEYGLYDYPQIVKVSFIYIYPHIYVCIHDLCDSGDSGIEDLAWQGAADM